MNIVVKIRLATALTTLILMLGMTSEAFANNKFFDQRYRGWLWFDESDRENAVDNQDLDSTEDKAKLPTLREMQEAKRENEKFAQELEMLKHLAIRHPDNLEYIKLYKLKEKEMMDRAQLLGINWLMANFLNPDIVDELENPQNIYGRDIKKGEKKNSDTQKLKDLSRKVELFVFRQDGCPYCTTLEKHLHRFANKYGFKVEAITPDNSQSRYFKSNSSPELIEALSLEVMPTVIAVVNDTRGRFELGRGAVSVADLEEKSLLLAKYLEDQAKQEAQVNNINKYSKQWKVTNE
jgi:thiol-disulfide isomerase/thioredoxin